MKPIRIVLSPTRHRALNIFLGLVLALCAVLLLLSLATYHATDASLDTAANPALPHAVKNWVGVVGSYTSDLLLQVLGLTAFLLPLWLLGLAWTWMRSRSGGSAILRWTGTVLSLVFVPAIFGLTPWHLHWPQEMPVEGITGRLVAETLVNWVNVPGAWIVTLILAATGVYFASTAILQVLLESVEDRWLNALNLRDRWRNWRDARAEEKEMRQAMRQVERSEARGTVRNPYTAGARAASAEAEDLAPAPGRLAALFGRRKRDEHKDEYEDIPAFERMRFEADAVPAEEEMPGMAEVPVAEQPRRKSIWERGPAEVAEVAAAMPVAETNEPEQDEPPEIEEPQPMRERESEWRTPEPRPAPRVDPRMEPRMESRQESARWAEPAAAAGPVARGAGDVAINGRAETESRAATVAPKNVSGYKLPPSTLLNSGEGPQDVREEELREEAKVLEDKCAEFDVRGRVVQINPGPMVTTYEFKPEAGVKYSRVTGLADDLCLAMRAESILIERMPGKSTVGIQVPNHEKETIHLRDVIESETFAKAKSKLTLAMGKDINGRIRTADLGTMPHVLIAGSTGSGKSVAINAMIMSLLYRTTPQQVRLILVDPKRVELGMYEGVPHLFTPIITEAKLAANALRNAVREMERRLKLLASRSVRNIDQYNKLFEGTMPSLFDEDEQEEPLPYIVIIIDELADLMMLDKANVEESITRLAQMARAVGIHLILATQRPSVDVITGLIKANVPTRISFRLATKVDSRTILDTNGAEALLGRGDMLFLPPGTSRLERLHAPYVSEKETAAVVGFWKAQGEADYAEGFLDSPKDEHGSAEGGLSDEDDNDPLYDDAMRLVFEFGKASTSLLQRRLRVGYGRAAHLIDMMERDGLVGPADGSRPRELLKAPGWLHEVPVQDE
ncbi:MAG: DNA translocase FtsK [Terracidiphilus sp.]|nr:DNA translocase FtsK [Terracidiphilus sp.]